MEFRAGLPWKSEHDLHCRVPNPSIRIPMPIFFSMSNQSGFLVDIPDDFLHSSNFHSSRSRRPLPIRPVWYFDPGFQIDLGLDPRSLIAYSRPIKKYNVKRRGKNTIYNTRSPAKKKIPIQARIKRRNEVQRKQFQEEFVRSLAPECRTPCERAGVIVVTGDSGRFATLRGFAPAAVGWFEPTCLRRGYTVVRMDECRTSKLCCGCYRAGQAVGDARLPGVQVCD
ncbi:hypothetical protein BC828DRAFT_645 [Blastocladiella britannica]|nr:hypothetical protein BC828DRAFT_645 [Blastocladiella britannica]